MKRREADKAFSEFLRKVAVPPGMLNIVAASFQDGWDTAFRVLKESNCIRVTVDTEERKP